jgi:DNA repair protein RadC
MHLYVRSGRRYRPAPRQHVLEVAAAYQLEQFPNGSLIRSPSDAKTLVATQLRGLASEHFGVLWLSARHKTIRWEVLFTGTIDGASVYPSDDSAPDTIDRTYTVRKLLSTYETAP